MQIRWHLNVREQDVKSVFKLDKWFYIVYFASHAFCWTKFKDHFPIHFLSLYTVLNMAMFFDWRHIFGTKKINLAPLWGGGIGNLPHKFHFYFIILVYKQPNRSFWSLCTLRWRDPFLCLKQLIFQIFLLCSPVTI